MLCFILQNWIMVTVWFLVSCLSFSERLCCLRTWMFLWCFSFPDIMEAEWVLMFLQHCWVSYLDASEAFFHHQINSSNTKGFVVEWWKMSPILDAGFVYSLKPLMDLLPWQHVWFGWTAFTTMCDWCFRFLQLRHHEAFWVLCGSN